MKLYYYDNQQRILDFLKNSGISLSEEEMKQAAKELDSYGVLDLPIKIGDTLYGVLNSPFRGSRVLKFEVCGVNYDFREIICFKYQHDGGLDFGWINANRCFLTYEEAEARAEKMFFKPARVDLDINENFQEKRKWWYEKQEKAKRDMVYALSEKMKKNCFAGLSDDAIKNLSSAIVSSGMLVPPITALDTVYYVFENDEESCIKERCVDDVSFDGEWGALLDLEDWEYLSEYILTYEEAERVLNELRSKRQHKK